VTEVGVDRDGLVDPAEVAAALRPDTAVVSVMTANNEIGTVQPIGLVAEACRAAGVPFHTDAVQATGRVPVDVAALGLDLLSLSGHKMYGPQGIGALWARRRGRPRIRLTARQIGGGQERGLRSGTLPVPLIVGLGKAAELAADDLRSGAIERVRALRDRLLAALLAIPGAHLNASRTHRLPNNVSVRFDDVPSDALMAAVRHDVALSASSACSTGHLHGSHVLHAIGLDEAEAGATVRLGLGRTTTDDDVARAAAAITRAVDDVRRGSRVG
jgi:cysteine desulfurase